jgi:two-component system phosphate regulon response regulator PhoB
MATILVVDDHPDIRQLIRMTLEIERHKIVEAVNGRVAVAAAAQIKPDVILLDVMMPGMGGLQACREIRTNPTLAQTRVIMLSALGSETDRAAGMAAGADAYLVKPFSPITLIGLVSSDGAQP